MILKQLRSLVIKPFIKKCNCLTQSRREAGVLRHHRGRDPHASNGPQDRLPDQLRGHVPGNTECVSDLEINEGR